MDREAEYRDDEARGEKGAGHSHRCTLRDADKDIERKTKKSSFFRKKGFLETRKSVTSFGVTDFLYWLIRPHAGSAVDDRNYDHGCRPRVLSEIGIMITAARGRECCHDRVISRP